MSRVQKISQMGEEHADKVKCNSLIIYPLCFFLAMNPVGFIDPIISVRAFEWTYDMQPSQPWIFQPENLQRREGLAWLNPN